MEQRVRSGQWLRVEGLQADRHGGAVVGSAQGPLTLLDAPALLTGAVLAFADDPPTMRGPDPATHIAAEAALLAEGQDGWPLLVAPPHVRAPRLQPAAGPAHHSQPPPPPPT